MSEIPNIYLDSPDPLSVLLTKLSLRAEVYVDGNFCGTWAVNTAGSKRIPFHLIGEGSAWLHQEGEQTTHLSQRDLVIFPHDSHHIISNSQHKPSPEIVNQPMSNDGDTTHMICGFFEFENPAFFPILDALPQTMVLKSDEVSKDDRLTFLIVQILKELSDKRPGFYRVIDQLAFLLFIEALRNQLEQGTLGEGLLTALFDTKLGKVLNAIHQQPEFAWTLESLAEKALMSRSSLSDAFRQHLGESPMRYLTKWRMNEAKRMLKTTQLSVAQIADKSGYESEAAFRKAYKNTLGEPPGTVRASKT